LQLFVLNEEYLVIAAHQTALITSLSFVHTARRSYRLNVPVKSLDLNVSLGNWGLANGAGVSASLLSEKLIKPCHLEEGEVVTRFL